jgi:hypothetical protein
MTRAEIAANFARIQSDRSVRGSPPSVAQVAELALRALVGDPAKTIQLMR